MKKGKITTIETACIKGMIANNVATEEMATQLNRGVPTIEKEVERIAAESVREQLFINQTASGSKGVSVMTQAGAVRGDESKNKQSASVETERAPWIHKIN